MACAPPRSSPCCRKNSRPGCRRRRHSPDKRRRFFCSLDGFFCSRNGFFCSERVGKNCFDDKNWFSGVIPSSVDGIFCSIGANRQLRVVIGSSPEGNFCCVNAGVRVNPPIPRFDRVNKTVSGANKTIGRAKMLSGRAGKTIARPGKIGLGPMKTFGLARKDRLRSKTQRHWTKKSAGQTNWRMRCRGNSLRAAALWSASGLPPLSVARQIRLRCTLPKAAASHTHSKARRAERTHHRRLHAVRLHGSMRP